MPLCCHTDFLPTHSAVLKPSLCRNMEKLVPGKLAVPRYQSVELRDRNTHETSTVPSIMCHTARGAEKKWIKKLLTELTMPGPKLAVAVLAKRKMIDKNRIRTLELDVVSCRIG